MKPRAVATAASGAPLNADYLYCIDFNAVAQPLDAVNKPRNTEETVVHFYPTLNNQG